MKIVCFKDVFKHLKMNQNIYLYSHCLFVIDTNKLLHHLLLIDTEYTKINVYNVSCHFAIFVNIFDIFID